MQRVHPQTTQRAPLSLQFVNCVKFSLPSLLLPMSVYANTPPMVIADISTLMVPSIHRLPFSVLLKSRSNTRRQVHIVLRRVT